MQVTGLDRFLLRHAPTWALSRLRSRAAANVIVRHFEAGETGRRTPMNRRPGDGNAAVLGPTGRVPLRQDAREAERNNPWARRVLQVIANNVVGWGITPAATGGGARAKKTANERWKRWAESTQCDHDGRNTMAGLQNLAMRTIARDGDVLVRRHWQPLTAGLAVPLKLQLLESDFLDTTRDHPRDINGVEVIGGVQFTNGRLTGRWLFKRHPGAMRLMGSSLATESEFVPASEVIHVYRQDRIGQVGGVSWLAPVLLALSDWDGYRDATIMKQKVAACMVMTVEDNEAAPVGEPDPDDTSVEQFAPGMIYKAPVGKKVSFSNPPSVSEFDTVDRGMARAIAAGVGITYEDLTGDMSQVSFISGRLGRLASQANVHDWRWNMFIPGFCDGIWNWAMEALWLSGAITEQPAAEWTAPPLPMADPLNETKAQVARVRSGALTHDNMLREAGEDPETHWENYAAGLQKIDALGIILDSDPRRTTQAGNPREQAKASGAAGDENEKPEAEAA